MFNSDVLDVAIGMVFVYLVLSLICSAAHEIMELWLKKRATDLERGIRELLTNEIGLDPGNLVQSLYNHGLVNGLFKGTYQSSRIGNLVSYIRGTDLPSYIPSRNFALALMDLVLPGKPTQASGATNATPPTPPNVTLSSPPQPLLAPTDPHNPLYELRNAIDTADVLKGNDRVKKTLTSMVDAAGNDVSKARENIEAWFNSGMDRVSGWYKRRAQVVIFILGIAVAIALNADSIVIVRALSTNKPLRESMVYAAEEYLKNNASPSPLPSPSPKSTTSSTAAQVSASTTTSRTVLSSPSPKPGSSPSASPTASPSVSVSPTPSGSSAASPKASPSPSPLPPACKEDPNSPQCALERNLGIVRNNMQTIGLPIGWVEHGSDIRREWPGNHWRRYGGWWWQLGWHGLGWLLTALALSLGAPFWFDMLNKFIVVRSTVKPKEKSPDEKSKD